MLGISTNRYCTKSIECLKENAIEFVFRYYSQTTKQKEKVLVASEALALSRAGIHIAAVYEDAGDKASYFTGTEGKKDGYYAYYYAQKIHQPAGSAIYFAVDYDASSSEIQGGIRDYFNGVLQGFLDFSSGAPVYKIGVYGSGATCSWLREHLSFVKYAWLAEATGWRGSKTYNRWDVKQFVNSDHDLMCDLKDGWQRCESKNDFGQFVIEHI